MSPLEPGELSPALLPIYKLELSLGNAVARVDRDAWSNCSLSVVMRDSLHFDAIEQKLDLPPTVTRWENRDGHYALEAGFRCEDTRHSIAGPIART